MGSRILTTALALDDSIAVIQEVNDQSKTSYARSSSIPVRSRSFYSKLTPRFLKRRDRRNQHSLILATFVATMNQVVMLFLDGLLLPLHMIPTISKTTRLLRFCRLGFLYVSFMTHNSNHPHRQSISVVGLGMSFLAALFDISELCSALMTRFIEYRYPNTVSWIPQVSPDGLGKDRLK